MGVLLDVTLLLAVAKEAMSLGNSLPFALWASMALALPFFLGMAASLRTDSMLGVIRNPVQALIAQLLSLAMLAVFLAALAHQDLAAAYWGLAGIGGLMYLIGRTLSFRTRSLVFLLVVLGIVLWMASR